MHTSIFAIDIPDEAKENGLKLKTVIMLSGSKTLIAHCLYTATHLKLLLLIT
jgi:hypothetical protein